MSAFFANNIINAVIRGRDRDNKAEFVSLVKKGDILISQSSVLAGMVGHAAIMATDLWIVEMAGGGGSSASSSSSNTTLEDNNRRISKHDWFDEHALDSITVYRCPNYTVACMAADWAYTHYYSSSGGDEKNIHIRYSIVGTRFQDTDPSYCSMLVLQSYHFGTGSYDVFSSTLVNEATKAILPRMIPLYFAPPYTLSVVEMF